MGMGICDSLAVHMVTKTNQVDLLRVTTTNIQTHTNFITCRYLVFEVAFLLSFHQYMCCLCTFLVFEQLKLLLKWVFFSFRFLRLGFWTKKKYTLLFIYLANLDSCTSLVVVRLMIHVSVRPSIFRYSAIF